MNGRANKSSASLLLNNKLELQAGRTNCTLPALTKKPSDHAATRIHITLCRARFGLQLAHQTDAFRITDPLRLGSDSQTSRASEEQNLPHPSQRTIVSSLEALSVGLDVSLPPLFQQIPTSNKNKTQCNAGRVEHGQRASTCSLAGFLHVTSRGRP